MLFTISDEEIINALCKKIFGVIQNQLKLYHVDVCFDSISLVKERMEKGDHDIYFSAIDSISEREKYERESENIKGKYKTKSPQIHFPDVSVGKLIDIYQCGIEDEYKKSVAIYKKSESIRCSGKLGFVCFLFYMKWYIGSNCLI